MQNCLRVAFLLIISIGLAACAAGEGALPSTQAAHAPVPQHTANPIIDIAPSSQPTQLEIPTAYPGQVILPPLGDAYPGQETLPALSFAYPAGVASLTPAHTETITLTPTWAPPTITPFPANPTPTRSWNACVNYPTDGGEMNYPPPDLNLLHWVKTEVAERPALRLTGLNMPIGAVDPSPDGTGLALSFTHTAFNGPGGYLFGLLVIDRPGNSPWLAIEAANSEQHPYQWLQGSRLIWVNEGQLYTAKADGSQKVHYPLPERVYEVWSNGEWAIASGGDLWRVHLATRQGTKIEGVHSVTGSGINARLSTDSPELLINEAGRLIQVPLDPALPVNFYDRIPYGGRGGRIGRPLAIGKKYLFPGELEVSSSGVRTVVFERGNPQPIPLKSLLPLEEDQFPLGFSESQDGQWVAISIYAKNKASGPIPYVQIGSYLAPVDDLKNGRLIRHAEKVGGGWRTDSLAYYFVSEGVMTQISLPSYEESVVARIHPFIYVTASFLVLRQDSLIVLFDRDMQLRSLINLPYQSNEFSINAGNNDQLYISVSRPQRVGSDCVTSSWLDVIQAAGP